MKPFSACTLCPALAAVFCAPGHVRAQSAPVVSGVSAAQRPDDSRLVDITYSLSDASLCTVWVTVSDDGGATFQTIARTVSGDVGPNVSPGAGKQIVWDAGADIPGRVGNFRVRVYADDGNSQGNMVYVPAGSFQNYAGGNVTLPSFWIDKYEVTNQRYCEFLNAADPNSDHWVSGMEISRSGSAGSYSYAVNAGRSNYPIRYASKLDADAFAQWLSSREGRAYRLPTEQEWEKAAAWDPVLQVRYAYAFQSNNISCPYCNYNGSSCVGGPTEVGHYNGTSGTNDARTYYGCYDMSGNIWEWTSSIYSGSSYVLRGGAWNNSATDCATSGRTPGAASTRSNYDGFRLALDPN